MQIIMRPSDIDISNYLRFSEFKHEQVELLICDYVKYSIINDNKFKAFSRFHYETIMHKGLVVMTIQRLIDDGYFSFIQTIEHGNIFTPELSFFKALIPYWRINK